MALTNEKFNEIAALLLMEKLEKSGDIVLNPSEAKRQVVNFAKKLEISLPEAASFFERVIKEAYEETIDAILSMTTGKVEKQ